MARLNPYESYYWSPEHKRRPAAVPNHAVRRGHRGGEGHLREHRHPDGPDVAAHPGVVHARAVHHGDTGGVLVSLVGAVLPLIGVVRAERLPVGQSLPPDAAESCRGVL